MESNSKNHYLKAISHNWIMEDAIISYANTLSKENKDRFIEYIKMCVCKDMDEYIDKRKMIGSKHIHAINSSFQDFLVGFLPMEEVLDKIQNKTQSHST
jgi:hypothetical protein